MTILSIEKEFDEDFVIYNPKDLDFPAYQSFKIGTEPNDIKSFYHQKFDEREREIIDIIINWEKKLGGLKTKDGGYVNLTYLLGKISDFKK